MKYLLATFSIITLLSCAEVQYQGFNDYYWSGGWQPEESVRQEWLAILGTDSDVQVYIGEVRQCIRDCQKDKAVGYMVFSPDSPQFCTCIYQN